MANDVNKLKDRIKMLEDARAKLSRDWLGVEREKTKFAAAFDNLQIGVLMLDDYNKVTFKNDSVEKILGSSTGGEWTVEEIRDELDGTYDLKKDITACLTERVKIGPKDMPFRSKTIRIFVSPIEILKKSLTVPGTVLLIEDITTDEKSWVNQKA